MSKYKKYRDIFEDKFINSQKIYLTKININEPSHSYLKLYQIMNVFSNFPKSIILPIKKEHDKILNMNLTSNDTSDFKIKNNKMSFMNSTNDLLELKIKELQNLSIDIGKLKKINKVRRYFDYEIRDKITNILNDSYITNAWVKMYELLFINKLFNNKLSNNKTINTFHICEHPGAFIYACSDYIKFNHPNKNHDFIFQSLNPNNSKNKKIFKVENKLLSTYHDKLDYGPKNSGDITDVYNILYYQKKYKNMNFDLITSDCGLDCSADFSQQENKLIKIFFGAFLCAIGVSNEGNNYIFKMFSFVEKKTIELLSLCCLFYKIVDITRPLATKGGSGEIYIVCKNFIKLTDFDHKFNQLIKYYKNYDNNNDEFILSEFDEHILKRIIKSNYILSMRRIININQLIFRYYNTDYAQKNSEVRKYIQRYTDYYADYYLQYIGLDKLK
jgi:23S rRNA U2552 (ribose-2'-O)-methylase RlmE/FtsJ